MKGRTKWILLIALALFAAVAVVASAEEPQKNGENGAKVTFKMNDLDEDDDEDVAEPQGAAETEDNEEVADDNEVASDAPKETKKTFGKRKVNHMFDDDEFEGTVEVKQQRKTNKPQKVSVDSLKKQQEAAQLAEKQMKEQELLHPRDWRMEMVMISIVSTYLCWFVVGMIINTSKANRWVKNMRGFFDEQFAQIGDPFRKITDLERESFHQFYLQATGRVNIIGARFLLDVCFCFFFQEELKSSCF